MRVSVRLALVYAAVFLYVGVYLPFWPVWLASRGMDPDRIGLLLGIGPWTYVWAPWVGARADRGDPRRWTSALALVLSGILLAFGWGTSFAALFVLSIALGLAFAPIVPLTDGLALHDRGVDYGRVRLFGSAAFIVASVAGGFALEGRAPEVILTTLQAIAVIVLASTLVLPARVEHPAAPREAIGWRTVLRVPGFRAFLLTGACLQAGHAVLYTFGTKHWLAVGIHANTIGWLWATGVIAEIVLFAVGARVSKKIGATGLLIVAAIGHVLRWTLLANVTDAAWLFAIQLLHGASFGALHLGSMQWIRESVDPSAVQRATTLYVAVAGGLALGASMMAAGFLYERTQGAAYYAMAGLGAAGLLAAVWLRRRP